MSHGSHSHGGTDEHATMATNASTAMNRSMDHPSNMGGHDEAAMHAMTFHLRTDLNLLFEPWDISTTEVLVGSCIAVLVLSALYEGMKIFRAKLMNMHARKKREIGKEHAVYSTVPKQGCRQVCNCLHLTQTAIHLVQVVLGYLLMLVVMTYQVYLGIAVILGAGLGYFFFAGLITEGVQRKPNSCPDSTQENTAIVLGVTNFNDIRNGPQMKEHTSSRLGVDNNGFGHG